MKKTKKQHTENVRCIIILASDEKESIDKAALKENKQLRYINEYANAHGLIVTKIVRMGCFSINVAEGRFVHCIELLKQGIAEAVLLANMHYIGRDEFDIYNKVGLIRGSGFRIFTVDDGELVLNIHPIKRKVVNKYER